MAAEADKLSDRLIEQRGWWTKLKKQINEIFPVVDAVIRLREAHEFEEKKKKKSSPFQTDTVECEGEDVDDLLFQGVQWGLNEGLPYVIETSEEAIVEVGMKVVAVDDEEVTYGSVEEFKGALGADEVNLEVHKPQQKWVKKFRKIKKLGDDIPIDWPEWEKWWNTTQTPEAKWKRMGPKKQKKRDELIAACKEIGNSLDDGELKTRLMEMLERLGQPFSREELGEYNFSTKKVMMGIQKKERELLAEIKEAKKEEEAQTQEAEAEG